MFGSEDIRYGFAVGRVRVLESRLLGATLIERLLDAPSFEEQKRVLLDTHVGRFLAHAATARDVEAAIDASLADLYEEFLERSELPEPVIAFFRLPHDYTNLRAALKKRILGVTTQVASAGMGSLDASDFEAPDELPGLLGKTARDLSGRAERPSSLEIDIAIDRAQFAALLEEAEASGLDYLTELARAMADAADVKVLMRAALSGATPRETAAMLVGTGRLDGPAFAARVATVPAQDLAAGIVATGLLPGTDPAALADLTMLDPALDSMTAALMRRARMAASGPEPVLGYVLAREAEALSLRAVLVGKLSGLDRETVRSRLRGVAA